MERWTSTSNYLFLELLVDGIKSILDGDSLQIPGCYFQAQWKMKVNLADWWSQEKLLEDLLVFNSVWRGVELPVDEMSVT